MTKRRIAFLLSVVFVGAVVACASIVSKSFYPVTIKSNPDQADITIRDESGSIVFEGKTPTTVTLDAKRGYFKGKDYTVDFHKAGYAAHEAELKRGVDGWYILGNIVFGGLIGWLIVDPATGAMWTLPKELSVDLTKEMTSRQESQSGLHVVTLDDVPQELRFQLLRIK